MSKKVTLKNTYVDKHIKTAKKQSKEKDSAIEAAFEAIKANALKSIENLPPDKKQLLLSELHKIEVDFHLKKEILKRTFDLELENIRHRYQPSK